MNYLVESSFDFDAGGGGGGGEKLLIIINYYHYFYLQTVKKVCLLFAVSFID